MGHPKKKKGLALRRPLRELRKRRSRNQTVNPQKRKITTSGTPPAQRAVYKQVCEPEKKGRGLRTRDSVPKNKEKKNKEISTEG